MRRLITLDYILSSTGLRVTYDLALSPGNRVQSVEVLCTKCQVPKYVPLDLQETYALVVPSYLANGGDGFDMIKNNKENHQIGR